MTSRNSSDYSLSDYEKFLSPTFFTGTKCQYSRRFRSGEEQEKYLAKHKDRFSQSKTEVIRIVFSNLGLKISAGYEKLARAISGIKKKKWEWMNNEKVIFEIDKKLIDIQNLTGRNVRAQGLKSHLDQAIKDLEIIDKLNKKYIKGHTHQKLQKEKKISELKADLVELRNSIDKPQRKHIDKVQPHKVKKAAATSNLIPPASPQKVRNTSAAPLSEIIVSQPKTPLNSSIPATKPVITSKPEEATQLDSQGVLRSHEWVLVPIITSPTTSQVISPAQPNQTTESIETITQPSVQKDIPSWKAVELAEMAKKAALVEERAKKAIAFRAEEAAEINEVIEFNKHFSIKIVDANDYYNKEDPIQAEKDKEAAILAVKAIADERGSVASSEDYLREFFFPGTTWLTSKGKSPKLRAFLAVDSTNQIVGFSIGELMDVKYHIHRLAVRKNLSRHGKEAIGTRLVFDSLHDARREGYDKADLDYDANTFCYGNEELGRKVAIRIAFYARFSSVFKITTAEESYYDGEQTELTFYLKTYRRAQVMAILFQRLFQQG